MDAGPDPDGSLRQSAGKSAAEESGERLRDFADAASDWFWEMGPDLRFVYLSERIREVAGVGPEYFIGKRREDFVDSSGDPGQFRTHLDDLRNRRPFRDFVYKLRTPQGDLRHFKISGKPIYDENGSFAGYRGTGTDITSLMESRRRLDYTTALLRATLEHMDQGISVTDGELNLVLWNDRFLELLEFPRDFPGPHGRPFADFIRYNAERGEYGPGDVEEQVRERVELAKRFEPHSFRRTRPDGVVIEIVGRPLPEGGFVTTYTDVTARERYETQLRRQADEMAKLVEDLRRSNSELEQFAYVASHDLQEPLRMVGSYCQLLQRRYQDKLDSDANEFIAYAVDGASRMQQLLNALLTYSRVGRSDRPKAAVDLGELASAAQRDLQKAIEESGAVLEVGDLPEVMGDAAELRQLLQNLFANAIKFRGDATPVVRAEAAPDDAAWRISVSDNGIGIDPAYAERIFQIFQRLHARGAYPGTGVGLAVCKKIVERHGGRIWVESQGDAGSTFHFTLPASEEAGE